MILHISDLHIGEGRIIPDYIQRYEDVLNQVFQAIEDHQVTHVLISGDIFHRADLRNEEKDLIIKWLSELNSYDIPVYMINGQHDIINPQYTHLATCNYLIEHKCWTNIHLVTEGHKLFEHDDWDLLAIPFDHNLNETKLRGLVAQYKNKDKPLIVMGHLMVKNTVTSSGYSLPGGLTLPDDIEDVYWALGDIHNRHAVSDRAWYAGSILQHTWGDKEDAYGGVMITKLDPLEILPIDFKYRKLVTLDQGTVDTNDLPDAWIKVVKDYQTVPLEHPSIVKHVNKKIVLEDNPIPASDDNPTTIIASDFRQDVLDNLIPLMDNPEDAVKTVDWLVKELKE